MPIRSRHKPLATLLLVGALLLAPCHAAAEELVPPMLTEHAEPELPAEHTLSSAVTVSIELTVDEQGQVKDPLLASSGDAVVDQAALTAVLRLRFQPATRDGLPIAARIPFRYDIAPSPVVAEPAPSGPAPLPPTEQATVQAIVLDVRGERPSRDTTKHQLEAEQVRTLPGTNGDPLRAVESLPGVARPPYMMGDLIVRGSAPQDSAVYVDGIPVPSAYHFGGLSSVVPAEALAKLEFRPGNFGPEYGRAMGGVVELGLATPRTDRFSGLLQIDSIDGRFVLQGPLGKKTRLLVAGRRSWLDAWLPKVLDGDEVSLRAAPVYYDGQLILEHDLSRRTRARLFVFGSHDKLALLFKSPDEQDPGSGGSLAARTGFLRVGLRLTSELRSWLTWTNTASWGPDRTNLTFGIDTFDFVVQQLYARSELRARFSDKVTGALGIDAGASMYDLNLNVRPYPTSEVAQGPYFARPTRRFVETLWLLRPAAYALLELTPLRGLRLLPSVRVDYTHETERVTVDPRLNARATLHDGPFGTTLKGGVGLYHQPPLPEQSVSPFGTPGIRSNRALHASLGVEQSLGEGLSVSLEGFYKQLDRLVVAFADEAASALGARFENSGSGRVYGSELLLRYQSSRVNGWLAYTLSRSERRDQDRESYRLFQYDQTHILSALASVQLGWGMSLGGRFRFISGSPHTPFVGGVLDLDAGAYAPIPGSLYSTRLPSFHQLDLRFDKTWQFGESARLTAYLELRNTYNHQNAEGRSYSYDYSRSRREPGLPIMPVIGLRGEL